MDPRLTDIQNQIDTVHEQGVSAGEISDGYHTFNELYHHREMLFISLCLTSMRNKAWKSLLHDPDQHLPMYNGMFIAGVDTPTGQATYHLDIDPYWSMMKGIRELNHAPVYDGHSPDDAIQRIYDYAVKLNEPATRDATEWAKNLPLGVDVIVENGRVSVPTFDKEYRAITPEQQAAVTEANYGPQQSDYRSTGFIPRPTSLTTAGIVSYSGEVDEEEEAKKHGFGT